MAGYTTPPLWRFFIADLDGYGITDFSKIASNRVVEVVLNAPLSIAGQVPSDNPQVWLPYTTDGYDDPYLAEGTRLIWGFRRESDVPPYYTVRAATLCNMIEDNAEQDDARTSFMGWDPWHYLLSRPVRDDNGDIICDADDCETAGRVFPAGTPVAEIIGTVLRNTITYDGFAYVDAGDGTRIGEGAQYQDWGGSVQYAGTLEGHVYSATESFTIGQGTSVGQVWAQLTAQGVCDIILNPIYEPLGRTFGTSTVFNYLVELNVYEQAGVVRDEQIFAWDLPGRSLVGLNRQQDGSVRANNVMFAAGQGGSGGFAPVQTDAASEAKYGYYGTQQFFPGITGADAVSTVTYLAAQQLFLRKSGRQTVVYRPAPERSPRPWQDYQLGDRCPVWASRQKFRQLLTGEAP